MTTRNRAEETHIGVCAAATPKGFRGCFDASRIILSKRVPGRRTSVC